MKIFDIATSNYIEAVIQPLTNNDIPLIKRNKQFIFNWQMIKGKPYKLTRKTNPEILGLISLVEHGEGWHATEIELLEIVKENVGKNKMIDGIADCLIAFACRESVMTGHGGWVFLTPKTLLEKHYQTRYGFIPFGTVLVSDNANSLKLIKKHIQL